MTRSRFAVIITVLSLLGFTLTPQAYFPCCCKGGCKTGQPAAPAPCCQVQKPVKSCCGASSAVESCPLHNSLKKNCPNCRCLEHLHVVVLTGPTAGDTTPRVPVAVLTSALPHCCTAFAGEGEGVSTNQAYLGMAILLKTCTLVC